MSKLCCFNFTNLFTKSFTNCINNLLIIKKRPVDDLELLDNEGNNLYYEEYYKYFPFCCWLTRNRDANDEQINQEINQEVEEFNTYQYHKNKKDTNDIDYELV